TIVIMDTNNGVFGQFGNAPDGSIPPNDFPGLIQPFIFYNSPVVELEFLFANTFQSQASTPKQIATAHALDLAVIDNCIPAATAYLGNFPLGSALLHQFDLVAPEELASIYEASFSQATIQTMNLERRMNDIRDGSLGFCSEG